MERSASAPSLLSAGDARVSDGAAGVSGFDVADISCGGITSKLLLSSPSEVLGASEEAYWSMSKMGRFLVL